MSRSTDLSGQNTVFTHFRAAGNTDLRAEERRFAHLHIMRDLNEIIYLHILANDGASHHRAVDGRVSANLHVVFDDDIAYLRDLLIHALCVRFKTKAVRTDDYTGM